MLTIIIGICPMIIGVFTLGALIGASGIGRGAGAVSARGPDAVSARGAVSSRGAISAPMSVSVPTPPATPPAAPPLASLFSPPATSFLGLFSTPPKWLKFDHITCDDQAENDIVPTQLSLKDCQDSCLASPRCAAVVVNRIGLAQCYHQSKASASQCQQNTQFNLYSYQLRDLQVIQQLWSLGIGFRAKIEDSRPFFYRINGHPTWALICLLPKSGSTPWSYMMTQGLLDQGFELHNSQPYQNESLRPHGLRLPYSVPQVSLAKIPTRLMFVRHPISRLLSGYLGKAVTNKILINGWSNDSGFSAFVDIITATAPENLNHHFRLQTDHDCGLYSGFSYRILRVETIGSWYREIVCLLGLQQAASRPFELTEFRKAEKKIIPQECFLRTQDCGCAINCGGVTCNQNSAGPNAGVLPFSTYHAASQRLEEFYDPRSTQQVNTWAAEDLRIFGYKAWRGPHSPIETI
jgi:hypothetical protein